MPRKTHKPVQIVAKLRQVDVLVSQGRSVAEPTRVTRCHHGWACQWTLLLLTTVEAIGFW